ncbi:MAG: hypothetical protein EOO76_13120 [Novosphingobium sp.]|nr:MAG: hypothetical protein EOO76_13120 [Novosphingobium sp.]
MTRTSSTHPLQIAEVWFAEGYGAIGITFCPGKKQRGAFTGEWDRDLAIDLEVVQAWNAAAVVTLLEDHEFSKLGVTGLGQAVEDRHMQWYGLPIRDVSTPDQAFEDRWASAGEELRAILRDGFNVLVHCKGGLGRAGMTAARLLIELGMKPQNAIDLVREARPGAIETPAQMQFVRDMAVIPERRPQSSREAIEDRALGAMIGLAVGDAVGTTLEFKPRDQAPRLVDMVGGGPFRLKPGQWTDDTSMALALMDSLLTNERLDEGDLLTRFVDWHENGTYSSAGRCFDIGITTRGALARWKTSGDSFAGSTNPRTAGNGSLMRLAPVAIRYWNDLDLLCDIAARQSRTTHGAPEAVDACVAFAEVLAHAIAGRPRSAVMQLSAEPCSRAISQIMGGAWRGKARDRIASSGYVAHSLEAALWCVGRTGTFAQAVLLAANLGEDADTTAAITGQFAGALYGASGIPPKWKALLADGGNIEATARQLFAAN